MNTIILASVLLFLSSARANQDDYSEQLESGSRNDKDDVAAYESFNAPVYGGLKPGVSGKGYPLPPPAPAGYSAYLNSLMPFGYGNAYGMMPYTAPYLGAYGAPYAAGYGFGGPAYGYPAGLPYGNAMLGRSAALNSYAYGAYPGLGYRFGGLGFNTAAYRAPAVPAAVAGVLPPAYAGGAVPVPAKGNSLQYGYAPPVSQKLPVY